MPWLTVGEVAFVLIATPIVAFVVHHLLTSRGNS